MCGRYALVLRPASLRRRLGDYGLPVAEPRLLGYPASSMQNAGSSGSGTTKEKGHHDNEALEHLAPSDEEEDPEGTRQSYNIAPGYIEPVYRAISPLDGEHKIPEDEGQQHKPGDYQVSYVVQGMKWGLVPSWTKRNPDYRFMMKTINCRDDSLSHNSGMWNSMKKRKRCVVPAEGFYEWKKNGKEKTPYYIKRKDGNLMYMAGLWDCVTLPESDGSQPSKSYTYTIITVPASSQMQFLHDRMPALLTTPEEILAWLDPTTNTWTPELQNLLRPFPGDLEMYPVPKEVGKVGNNDKSFVLPRDAEENKSNIKQWFGEKGAKRSKVVKTEGFEINAHGNKIKAGKEVVAGAEKQPEEVVKKEVEKSQTEDNPSLPDTEEVPEAKDSSPAPIFTASRKRTLAKDSLDEDQEGPHHKEQKPAASTTNARDKSVTSSKPQRWLRSSTTNPKPAGKAVRNKTSKKQVSGDGSMKITNFFPK